MMMDQDESLGLQWGRVADLLKKLGKFPSISPYTGRSVGVGGIGGFKESNLVQRLLAENQKERSYSCTMLYIPTGDQDRILDIGKQIDPKDLSGDGLEDSPHVTLKYGTHTSDPEDVWELIDGYPSIPITLGKLSTFPPNEEEGFEVLKIDVESQELTEIHDLLSEKLENTDKHAESGGYKPHLTIAYLKTGAAQKYLDLANDLEGETFDCSTVVFSDQDGNHFRKTLKVVSEGYRPLPVVGDKVKLVTGAICRVIDFGTWKAMKGKYPDIAVKTLSEIDVPEHQLGRTWVVSDDAGDLWMMGSKSMQMFATVITESWTPRRFTLLTEAVENEPCLCGCTKRNGVRGRNPNEWECADCGTVWDGKVGNLANYTNNTYDPSRIPARAEFLASLRR
jgi:2'-5' RNA ligase